MSCKKVTVNQIQKYKLYLLNEEKSLATIEKYMRDIRMFYKFLDEDKLVDKEKVIAYKQMLSQKYKVSSMNSMLIAVNQFLTFLKMNDCQVKLQKIQKKIFMEGDKELTRDEYMRLLKTARNHGHEKLALIMQTICATGIRVTEHQYITVEAVKLGKVVVKNKGKVREIFIPKKLRKMLLSYCRNHHIMNGTIFVTKSGNPLHRSNIWTMMKKLCHQAGVEKSKVFPHNLRHLFAFTFYNIEKNLAHLADILGHSSIETTRIYTKSRLESCEDIFNKMGLIFI